MRRSSIRSNGESEDPMADTLEKPKKLDWAIVITILAIIGLTFVSLLFTLFPKCSKKRITLTNSKKKTIEVDAEIAKNFFTMSKGLMGRPLLLENTGMLFIFSNPGYHSFWMTWTQIPLEAIFFDEKGIVVDILQMEPNTSEKHISKSKAKYVFEVNPGFSEKNSILASKSRLDLACISI